MAVCALPLSNRSGNHQLTKTLERVLEDAQLTGELKLCGRKLKEFPKNAQKYDLSDTVLADLSKNRFGELPSEVCEFFLLERLDCYHNVIRSLPDSVITLHSLTYLNLSRNHLSTIPPALCQLPLEVLDVSNNKLVSLPEEIGHMQCLMDLDVSCNEITILPPQIGDLQSLKSFNIRRNLLVELPPEFCELHLVKLDISGNRISSIPISLRQMKTLQELVLEHNPLTSPPSFLCSRGKIHIFKFLEMLFIREDKKQGLLLDSEFNHPCRKPTLLNDFRYQNGLTDSRLKRYTVDSGYNTSDGGDRRWSQELQDLNSDAEEARKLALRAAEFTKEQRQERERDLQQRFSKNEDSLSGNGSSSFSSTLSGFSSLSTPSTLSPGSEFNFEEEINMALQEKYLKSNQEEEINREESKEVAQKLLDLQREDFRATHDLSAEITMLGAGNAPVLEDVQELLQVEKQKSYSNMQVHKEYKNAIRFQQSNDKNLYRSSVLSHTNSCNGNSPPETKSEMMLNYHCFVTETPKSSQLSPEKEFRVKHEALMNRQRYEAVLAQQHLEKEMNKRKQIQKQAVMSYVKQCTSPVADVSDVFEVDANLSLPCTPTKLGFNGTVHPSWPQTDFKTPPDQPIQAIDPNFTFRRELEKAREEQELIEKLRRIIETRLKVTLPDDLGSALMDGVVLCHLANQVRPRSVCSIHVPSPAVPTLSMAKCRRNVENFLEACYKNGVPQELICSPQDVLEERSLAALAITVEELLNQSFGTKFRVA
ncbi:leucine-rich repeat and calponin homology domain-containing protein 1-like isoform X1 [Tachypleus tridentatus]|uniref:leucine-rich repeat and calponin homology domain-containing protein 1-like isoform X1 n=2 Tax=Tachypleus tridentatus TaxID=6853 RepID=UPI003FD2D4C1